MTIILVKKRGSKVKLACLLVSLWKLWRFICLQLHHNLFHMINAREFFLSCHRSYWRSNRSACMTFDQALIKSFTKIIFIFVVLNDKWNYSVIDVKTYTEFSEPLLSHWDHRFFMVGAGPEKSSCRQFDSASGHHLKSC